MIVLIYGGSLVMRHVITIGDLVAFMRLPRAAGMADHLARLDDCDLPARQSRDEAPGRDFRRRCRRRRSKPTAPRFRLRALSNGIDVSFSYFARDGFPNDGLATNGDGHSLSRNIPYALKNINVKVPAGEKLAIVGRTGSGKSTMVKLLARLIEPTAGRVLLDGRDTRELTCSRAPARDRAGAAGAHAVFRHAGAQYRFRPPGASIAEIESCARTAGLEGDIAVLPRGLETIVGERGMSLSGGQKQRVTIARLLNYHSRRGGARRRALERRYRDRERGAQEPHRERGRPHHDSRRPSRLDRARRRPDHRARGRRDRRARHPRGT